jgi:hypothetical protein
MSALVPLRAGVLDDLYSAALQLHPDGTAIAGFEVNRPGFTGELSS